MKRVYKNKFIVLFSIALLKISLFVFSSSIAALETYNYTDNRPASQNPPGGLSPSQVPQFVIVGFDDNSNVTGMNWTINFFNSKTNPAGTGNAATYDGAPVKVSYYHPTTFINTTGLKQTWNQAMLSGHEVANHTHSHPHGLNFTVTQWENEMTTCNNILTQPYSQGVGASQIFGFRTPFLEYNGNMPIAAKNKNMWYDCSIEEGFQPDQNGTNFYWPYTLDNGSPCNQFWASQGRVPLVGSVPGLWELPVYCFIVPPDDKCAQYGVPAGLRAKVKNNTSTPFDVNDGKITGMDWNLWDDFKMTRPEFVATLKYTLDLRLQGNRAPFTFGAHSTYYNTSDKQQAMQDFINYALSKPEVRIVSAKQALDWLRNPVALGGQTATPTPTSTPTTSISPTATNTPTASTSVTPTATNTNTNTNTPTPSSGATPTVTNTNTPTASSGVTPTATNTNTPTPSGGAPSWAPNTYYAVNALCTYGGYTYKCIQAHTSLIGWEPPNVPALWQRM